MGNMFRCTLKSGGASGTGIPLIVTCSEDFAGKTITATDGTTTLTQTCPSTSPYTVQFDLPNTGSWTISGVIEGQTYSETISVTEYQLELSTGFNFKTWVSLGDLDPDDYASLSAVFADEAAVRRLMLVHASADYLIDCVRDDITVIDDFCANDTAMKWLGLCDYVCDGLTAITGVEAKFLASTYWERYLKDHVPVMTSNTAPYGVASASSVFDSNNAAYQAFNPSIIYGWHASNGSTTGYLTYKFVAPTCVKRVYIKNSTYRVASSITVQGSNNGSTFEDIQTLTVTDTSAGASAYYDISNSEYYLYYRLNITASVLVESVNAVGFVAVQFYGRALNVSVPVMTSNTAPYGEASASSYRTNNEPYKAFDGVMVSAGWQTQANATLNDYIRYKFKNKIMPKKAIVIFQYYTSSDPRLRKFKIQGSNDGTNWDDVSDVITAPTASSTTVFTVEVDLAATTDYQYLQLKNMEALSNTIYLFEVQFYGLDYSEKEFEAGTTKKWLYDHGLELEVLSERHGSGGTAPTRNSDYIYFYAGVQSGSNHNYSQVYTILDLTNYDLIRAKVGDYFTTGQVPIIVANSTSFSAEATNAFAADYAPNNAGLDISSFDSSHAVIFGIQSNAQGSGSLKELWLE